MAHKTLFNTNTNTNTDDDNNHSHSDTAVMKSKYSEVDVVERKINFGAGPAALPLEVLKEFSRDMINLGGNSSAIGVGIGELSHRTGEFEHKILGEANRRILELAGYEEKDWQVLWMTGGGTGQFAAIPLNFAVEGKKCLYLITGTWSEKATEEAKKLIKPELIVIIDLRAKTADLRGRRSLLEPANWIHKISPKDFASFSYIYYCDNETVDGIELPSSEYFQSLFAPHYSENQNNNNDFSSPVFIGDLSSNFLSRKLPKSSGPTGVLFAGVQKNLGAAGVTVVLIKRSLINKITPQRCPSVLDYKITAKNNSLLNTPPVMSIHLCNLVLKDLKAKFPGGLEDLNKFSEKKSKMLYEALDEADNKFYCDVDVKFRSRMNVVFKPVVDTCDTAAADSGEVTESFLKLSSENQMIQLKGHRSVGGLRASLYNAITEDQVKLLVNLLKIHSSSSN